MKILDYNQIKKNQMKKIIWFVIKLRFLSTQKFQKKKIRKNNYIHFFFLKFKNLTKFLQFGTVTWHNHDV